MMKAFMRSCQTSRREEGHTESWNEFSTIDHMSLLKDLEN